MLDHDKWPVPNFMHEQTIRNLPDNQITREDLEQRMWTEFCDAEIPFLPYAKSMEKWLGELGDLGSGILDNHESFIAWCVDCLEISPEMAQLLGTGLQIDWQEYRDAWLDGIQK